MKTSNIYARIEPDVKEKAEAILESIGIPASVAINMYYKQIILSNGIPFNVSANSIPKRIDLDAMNKDDFNIDLENRYKEMKENNVVDARSFFDEIKKEKVLKECRNEEEYFKEQRR